VRKGYGNLEVQVLAYIRIKIQLALLHPMHHRGPGKLLGDRAGVEKCGFSGDWEFLLHIGITMAFCKEQRGAFHHGNKGPGNVIAFDFRGRLPTRSANFCKISLAKLAGRVYAVKA
jgi:hypothetical protein